MSVVLFIVILALLVLVHEFGHFIVAKKSGIRVDEFGLGFPPNILRKKIGETVYSLNLIPFGGFVKIFGENLSEETLRGPDSGRSFANKPRHIQAAVLAAGVFFNFLFAWFLISLGFITGLPVPISDYGDKGVISDKRLMVITVLPDSPAAEMGLRSGDVIVRLQSNTGLIQNPKPEMVQSFVRGHGGSKITLHYRRGKAEGKILVTPRVLSKEGPPLLGISMEEVGTLSLSVTEALIEGGRTTWRVTRGVAIWITSFLLEAIQGKTSVDDLIGPVGIAGLVGDVGELGLIHLLSFTAFISINLGVLNLLPFPALDGGRLLFVAIEAIIRRRINPAITNASNAVGFTLLLILMAAVTYHDIAKLVG